MTAKDIKMQASASKSMPDRIMELEAALRPLAEIANRYDQEDLDECRPSWVEKGAAKYNLQQKLYSGRGGNTLLTLYDAMEARRVLYGTPFSQPDSNEADEAKKIFETLYIEGTPWEYLSNQTRQSYIEKVKALKLK